MDISVWWSLWFVACLVCVILLLLGMAQPTSMAASPSMASNNSNNSSSMGAPSSMPLAIRSRKQKLRTPTKEEMNKLRDEHKELAELWLEMETTFYNRVSWTFIKERAKPTLLEIIERAEAKRGFALSKPLAKIIPDPWELHLFYHYRQVLKHRSGKPKEAGQEGGSNDPLASPTVQRTGESAPKRTPTMLEEVEEEGQVDEAPLADPAIEEVGASSGSKVDDSTDIATSQEVKSTGAATLESADTAKPSNSEVSERKEKADTTTVQPQEDSLPSAQMNDEKVDEKEKESSRNSDVEPDPNKDDDNVNNSDDDDDQSTSSESTVEVCEIIWYDCYDLYPELSPAYKELAFWTMIAKVYVGSPGSICWMQLFDWAFKTDTTSEDVREILKPFRKKSKSINAIAPKGLVKEFKAFMDLAEKEKIIREAEGNGDKTSAEEPYTDSNEPKMRTDQSVAAVAKPNDPMPLNDKHQEAKKIVAISESVEPSVALESGVARPPKPSDRDATAKLSDKPSAGDISASTGQQNVPLLAGKNASEGVSPARTLNGDARPPCDFSILPEGSVELARLMVESEKRSKTGECDWAYIQNNATGALQTLLAFKKNKTRGFPGDFKRVVPAKFHGLFIEYKRLLALGQLPSGKWNALGPPKHIMAEPQRVASPLGYEGPEARRGGLDLLAQGATLAGGSKRPASGPENDIQKMPAAKKPRTEPTSRESHKPDKDDSGKKRAAQKALGTEAKGSKPGSPKKRRSSTSAAPLRNTDDVVAAAQPRPSRASKRNVARRQAGNEDAAASGQELLDDDVLDLLQSEIMLDDDEALTGDQVAEKTEKLLQIIQSSAKGYQQRRQARYGEFLREQRRHFTEFRRQQLEVWKKYQEEQAQRLEAYENEEADLLLGHDENYRHHRETLESIVRRLVDRLRGQGQNSSIIHC